MKQKSTKNYVSAHQSMFLDTHFQKGSTTMRILNAIFYYVSNSYKEQMTFIIYLQGYIFPKFKS